MRISRSQIACPDSGSGLILGDFSVAEFYLSTLVAPALNCLGKFLDGTGLVTSDGNRRASLVPMGIPLWLELVLYG